MNSLILATATRILTPLLLLFSVFLLLRGHDEPGGGFSGGLVAAIAFTLVALAESAGAARAMLIVEPRIVVASGVAIALLAAVLGLISSGAPLSSIWLEATVPWGGSLKLGTPLVFDIGVFLVVLGASVTIILGLVEEA